MNPNLIQIYKRVLVLNHQITIEMLSNGWADVLVQATTQSVTHYMYKTGSFELGMLLRPKRPDSCFSTLLRPAGE